MEKDLSKKVGYEVFEATSNHGFVPIRRKKWVKIMSTGEISNFGPVLQIFREINKNMDGWRKMPNSGRKRNGSLILNYYKPNEKGFEGNYRHIKIVPIYKENSEEFHLGPDIN